MMVNKKSKKVGKKILLSEIPRSPRGKKDIMKKNVAEYQGTIFSLDEILEGTEEWFSNHKYILKTKKKRKRVKPLGDEIEVNWTASKAVDRYSQYVIKLRWLLKNVNTIRVKDTNKELFQGDIGLTIDAHIDKDFENKWDNTKFQKYLKHLYEKYIYERTFLRHKIQLWTESNAVYSLIKTLTTRYS